MIEIRKSTEVVEKQVYLCDICGKELSQYMTCFICKRHLCQEHAVYNWDDGDYPDVYCTSCWNAGKLFRQQQEEENERHNKTIDKLESDWETEALKIIKENNKNE